MGNCEFLVDSLESKEAITKMETEMRIRFVSKRVKLE